MKQHAKISASRVERIMNCPGSLALEVLMPDQTNEAAEKGTKIHALAEEILLNEQALSFEEYDDEILKPALQYAQYIKDYNVPYFIEVDLTPALSELHPDLGGTADCVMHLDKTLIVIDLKTGRIPITAKNNAQLYTYAVGAALKFEHLPIEKIALIIFQPNIGVSIEEISLLELATFERMLIDAANAANDPFATLNPGSKQCKYCRAKTVCPALKDTANELAKAEFNIPGTTIQQNLDLAELVGDWAEAIKAQAKETLISGGIIPGWELKEGRRIIKFANQTGSEAYLAGNPNAFTIKTPAQLKKLGIFLPEDHLIEDRSAPTLSRKNTDLS